MYEKKENASGTCSKLCTTIDYEISTATGFTLSIALKIVFYIALIVAEVLIFKFTGCQKEELCNCDKLTFEFSLTLIVISIIIDIIQVMCFCCSWYCQREDVHGIHLETPIFTSIFCFPNLLIIVLSITYMITTI